MGHSQPPGDATSEHPSDLHAVILRNMAEGVVLVRASDARIVYANPRFDSMLGYEPGELMGRPVSVVNYETEERNAEQVAADITARLERDGRATYEVQNVRKDGTPVWTRATTTVFDHPQHGQVWVAVHQDIDEQKRLALALREQQALLQGIVDNSTAVIFVKDRDGRYLLINQHFEQLFHVDRQSVLGRTDRDLFPPSTADQLRKNDLEVIQRRYPLELIEEVPHDDGTHTYISLKFPLFDDGEVRAVCGIATDVTERRHAQSALERQARELTRSNETLSLLAHALSHDLMAPARSAAGFLDLLERRCADVLGAEGVEFLGYARDGVRQVQAMVADLLAYARTADDSEGAKLVPSGEALRVSLQVLKADVAERSAQITSDELPEVRASPRLLAQLFQNLLANSLKYNRSPQPRIHVAATGEGAWWRFQVSDNGIGVDPAQQARLFSPYERGPEAASFPGHGIGLSICARIVERYGGRIWVEANPGQGATFCFTLPGADADGSEPPPAAGGWAPADSTSLRDPSSQGEGTLDGRADGREDHRALDSGL